MKYGQMLPKGEIRSTISEPVKNQKPNQNSFLASWINRRVRLVLMDSKEITGLLEWFDQFSLGLRMEGGETMVFKHSIAFIQRL
jgi:sRNA-binding regulator protein Hfq